MADLKGILSITDMDVFKELLAIVRAIVEDPDVPDIHKEMVQEWVELHRLDYALDQPIEIFATHAKCPLCGIGHRAY
jgi:L-fucose mutarotase/ribose pyranase (RbsD/FucU family)